VLLVLLIAGGLAWAVRRRGRDDDARLSGGATGGEESGAVEDRAERR